MGVKTLVECSRIDEASSSITVREMQSTASTKVT